MLKTVYHRYSNVNYKVNVSKSCRKTSAPVTMREPGKNYSAFATRQGVKSTKIFSLFGPRTHQPPCKLEQTTMNTKIPMRCLFEKSRGSQTYRSALLFTFFTPSIRFSVNLKVNVLLIFWTNSNPKSKIFR